MAKEEVNPRRDRWERATAWPGVAASVLFLIAYSWNILEEHKSRALTVTLIAILVVVWLFFLGDFVIRLMLSKDKGSFVRHNPVDLLSVFLPMARPFRLLTSLHRIPALGGDSGSHLRRRVIITAASFIVMFIYVISLAVFQAERYAHGSNIRSFGDSVWWACVTMSTVGYGDYYPVTIQGRVLAVVLMIGGIVIVGTASATIVSYLTDRTQRLRAERERNHPHDSGHDRG
ncbi:MAG: potassium channel family protein [Leifsonia sp.]|nr:potassium channel family protein [Leifsonia sp.]